MNPDVSSANGTLLGALGNTGNLIFILYALIIITSAIDESFEHLRSLKVPIQEKLLLCPGEMEKAQMNYLLQRIEDAKPINACGYFEIGKSTLTSMLSIRLKKTEIHKILIDLLSLTYIIILVQFKMSSDTDGCNCESFVTNNITVT